MEWLIEKYREITKSRRKALWFSAISALLLLLVCYFADNLKYSIMSGPSIGQRVEQFRELTGIVGDDIPEDVVFINVAYDRELVPVYDEYGLPKGEIDITNRERLARFLAEAKRYRYLMLDVLLSKDYQSASDSLLVSTLLSKDNITIARSEGGDLIDSSVFDISGLTDYATHILETNFVKYEFSGNRGVSLPLKSFKDMSGDSGYSSWGPFHFHKGKFCWMSLTLRFPTKLWTDTRPDRDNPQMGEKVLLNLGSDILDMGLDIEALVKDKIVLIGDFTEDDIHDTYIGKVAGPVINYNAYRALMNDELDIPWSLIWFLLIFYTAITFTIVRKTKFPLFSRLLKKLNKRSGFVRYVISFVGFSTLLSIVGICVYLIDGCDINIIIPSLWFTTLRGLTNITNDSMKS